MVPGVISTLGMLGEHSKGWYESQARFSRVLPTPRAGCYARKPIGCAVYCLMSSSIILILVLFYNAFRCHPLS